jgi:nicotinate-nucleotide pyrophosphorylase (carboxylating)
VAKYSKRSLGVKTSFRIQGQAILFTASESTACRRLVELAIAEDLGVGGDITSQAVIPETLAGRAVFVARAAGVLAGLPAVEMVLATIDPKLIFRAQLRDGADLKPGDRLATVAGPMRSILAAERTTLNFLQRLSGVATLTRRYVRAVAGLPCRILDTRKTTPGWRLLEKYAVRCGAGHNHRLGLYDGILVKDNHLAALRDMAREGRSAKRNEWEALRAALRAPHAGQIPVEIEVDNLQQLDEALKCGPQIILLDNMGPDDLREAVRRRDAAAPGVALEASGGVNLYAVRELAETGVDCISVGALTHSAPALDIALDYEWKERRG